MILPISTVLAALTGLLAIILAMRVVDERRRSKISLSDGGDERLLRRMRGQANLAEYAPYALILVALLEFQEVSEWLVLILAAMFFIGRVMHGYAFAFSDHSPTGRTGGTILTFVSIVLLSLVALVSALLS